MTFAILISAHFFQITVQTSTPKKDQHINTLANSYGASNNWQPGGGKRSAQLVIPPYDLVSMAFFRLIKLCTFFLCRP